MLLDAEIELNDNDNDDDDSYNFDGYISKAIDPSPWLLLTTLTICIVVTLILVPVAVQKKNNQQQQQEEETLDEHWKRISTDVETSSHEEEDDEESDDDDGEEEPDENNHKAIVIGVSRHALRTALAWDDETVRILRLGLPYTFSHVSSELFSNICLIFVSQFIGTSSAVAYALVHILVDLTDSLLHGPIDACSTLCSHAIGAKNTFLAGQYLQLAILINLILNIPVLTFWYNFMYQVIVFLDWGDETTARHAQSYIRYLAVSYVFRGVSTAVWEVLDATDRAAEGALLSCIQGMVKVLILWIVCVFLPNVSLVHVGFIYSVIEFGFLVATMVWAERAGWLQAFHKGLYSKFAVTNFYAFKTMIKTAAPLSWSYLSLSAEWTILTLFASTLGKAEVAAWAIVGNIWDLFYYLSAGFGEAAEIRTALHLGNNHPELAQISSYKSLLLGLVFSASVSLVFFSFQNVIPAWYTTDDTLQTILKELVPFVGLANLAMNFGMDCWCIVGALAKYDLATFISTMTTWGICIPLGAIFSLGFHFNLQGLMAASTMGYVTTGACLSYVVLTTNWTKAAFEISQDNEDDSDVEDEDDGKDEILSDTSRDSESLVDEQSPLLVTSTPVYVS
jgi:Na+-driven multidrug efflux pump